MTDQSELRDRVAAAIASVVVTIGPNSLTLLKDGHTLGLSGGEIDAMALSALAMVQPELDCLAAERDSLGRTSDSLRRGWVKMRKRAEKAEAELAAARADVDRIRKREAGVRTVRRQALRERDGAHAKLASECAAARHAGLLDAADVLDRIADMQDCVDDDQIRIEVLHTRNCAKAVRMYAGSTPVVE